MLCNSVMASIALALRQGLLLAKQYFLLILLVLIVLRLVRNKFKPTLSRIPGPPLAAYSQLWRLYYVWRGSGHLDAIKLHQKYGNLVRIGPNHVSVADPQWIPVIYGPKEDYIKVSHSVSEKDVLLRDLARAVSILSTAYRGRRSPG